MDEGARTGLGGRRVRGSRRDPAAWLVPAVVAVLAFAAFLPALPGEFLNWDDDRNFVENLHYRGLGPAQLGWMLTTTHMGHWIPLTWLTLGLDHTLWGMDPRGYHLTSLLLHAGAALALYALALRLLRLALAPPPCAARLGAAAAALLFAVHPLRVESVAWITERRDVLSGLFYILTLIAYLKAVDAGPRRPGWYWTSVALFAGAVLSKSITMTLPVILVILDVYPLRRLGGARGWRVRAVWEEKLPFVALSAAAAAVALTAVASLGNLHSLTALGLPVRLVLAIYGVAFYLFKTLLPVGLSPLYPMAVDVSWWHFAAAIGGSALALAARRRCPALTAAWLAYLITLGPVSGIFQNGPQVAADRYSYLAGLGWAVLAGAAVVRGRAASLVRAAAGLAILALAALTWQQAAVWRDSVALWQHAAAVHPESRAAQANLARAHEARGDLARAIEAYEEVLRLSTARSPWLVKLGALHEAEGDPERALARFLEALRLEPGLANACEGTRRLAPGRPAPVHDGCA
jgi:protein O-mannosyl-transferase